MERAPTGSASACRTMSSPRNIQRQRILQKELDEANEAIIDLGKNLKENIIATNKNFDILTKRINVQKSKLDTVSRETENSIQKNSSKIITSLS